MMCWCVPQGAQSMHERGLLWIMEKVSTRALTSLMLLIHSLLFAVSPFPPLILGPDLAWSSQVALRLFISRNTSDIVHVWMRIYMPLGKDMCTQTNGGDSSFITHTQLCNAISVRIFHWLIIIKLEGAAKMSSLVERLHQDTTQTHKHTHTQINCSHNL